MKGSKNKALFIDIDGTVVEDVGYVSEPRDLKLLPKVTQTLVKAQNAGFLLVFHSNKGGAFQKKGLTERGLRLLDTAFRRLLVNNGVKTKVYTYYCSHYPDTENQIQCVCRKPKTGLFDKAIKELNIDPKISFAIGDKISDLLPALAVSVKRVVLVKRNGEYFDIKKSEDKINIDRCNNLSEAFEIILSLEQKVV